MQRFVLTVTLVGVLFFLGSFSAIYIWSEFTINDNIKTAQLKYSGTAEEALISLLNDENNSPINRTHIAIWTLGQIKSEKALPNLYGYYKDDPDGNSCYGKHHSELCQYEIHKAIVAIERLEGSSQQSSTP